MVCKKGRILRSCFGPFSYFQTSLRTSLVTTSHGCVWKSCAHGSLTSLPHDFIWKDEPVACRAKHFGRLGPGKKKPRSYQHQTPQRWPRLKKLRRKALRVSSPGNLVGPRCRRFTRGARLHPSAFPKGRGWTGPRPAQTFGKA